MTPNRTNETPIRAYAGPTFHASPAASSLPMPKYFSKSVPNVDKTSSLKTMMEQEAPDTTSGSEESPSQEISQPAHDHRAREESPLDIFFRADREAKAKARPTKESGTENPNDQARLSASPSGPQTPLDIIHVTPLIVQLAACSPWRWMVQFQNSHPARYPKRHS